MFVVGIVCGEAACIAVVFVHWTRVRCVFQWSLHEVDSGAGGAGAGASAGAGSSAGGT